MSIIGCGKKTDSATVITTGNEGSDGGLLNVGEKGSLRNGRVRHSDTLTDQFDRAKAKANAEDTLSKHNDIDGMVGLAYNPPLILEALKQADKVGKPKTIAFPQDDATLQGIKDGMPMHRTVVQNPYMYIGTNPSRFWPR